MSNMTLIFLMGLICSSLIALSTNNWFQLWLALELNMMFFIPLMFNLNNLSINSMMKYYIIQTIASSIFIFIMISSQKFTTENLMNNTITLVMSMKLGLFPIYFWYPKVVEGLSWFSFILLSTWQKIIPLYILSLSTMFLYPMLISLSVMTGCLYMLNMSSLRKIFAYSSLTHMSWMILAMYPVSNNWCLYFIFYSTIMMMIYILMKKQDFCSLNSLKKMDKPLNLKLLCSMLSLGGLPPLLGFFPKLLIIYTTNQQLLWLIFILIMSSLVSIFIYMQMMYPSIFNKTLFKKMKNNNNSFYTLNTLGLSSFLFIMP